LNRFAGGLFSKWYHCDPWVCKDLQASHTTPASYKRFPIEINSIDTEEPIPEIESESLHYGVMEEIGCKPQPNNLLQKDDIQANPVVAPCDLMQVVHAQVCNGCDKYPITGILYQCLGCEIDVNKLDFDMCSDCVVNLPGDRSSHHSYHNSSHPVIRLPRPVGQILLQRARLEALRFLTSVMDSYSNTFTCQGHCGATYSGQLHYKCIQCEAYSLCSECIGINAVETEGHDARHLFMRFSGEPLSLIKPTDTSTETSDQQRIRMLEIAVTKQEETLRGHGEIMIRQEEAMRTQAETMRSMNDKFDRLMAFLAKTDA